jgi:hypothetical protein
MRGGQGAAPRPLAVLAGTMADARDEFWPDDLPYTQAPVEQVIAHFKSWRIFHADYRRPYHTYRDAYDAGRGLFFFSTTCCFE